MLFCQTLGERAFCILKHGFVSEGQRPLTLLIKHLKNLTKPEDIEGAPIDGNSQHSSSQIFRMLVQSLPGRKSANVIPHIITRPTL